MSQNQHLPPEAKLLLSCAKIRTAPEDEAAIHQALAKGVDWTVFAKMAVERGLAGLAGFTLIRIAPDLVPDDILAALRTIIDQTESQNRTLFDELDRIIKELPLEGAQPALRNARAAANAALASNPNDAAAWRDLGLALSDLVRHKEAILCYDRAIALAPNDPANWTECARARMAIGQTKATLQYIDKALSLDSRDARAWTIRARALSTSQRFLQAIEASDRAIALEPDNIAAARVGIHCRLFVCDWRSREDDKRRVIEGMRAGLSVISLFNHQALFDSEADNLTLARHWAQRFARPLKPLWRGERYSHDKIRIAYISTDFRDTLAVNAIAGCFEAHDKSRFETTAISLSAHDGSKTRNRIERAFDHFIDVQTMSDAQVAAMLHRAEIDIAIDVNGYSGAHRTEILARRPAPVQVNYLGFPGTMAASFIDYIIADHIVIPDDHQIHYQEKVAYLPDTYFPTDRKRRIADRTPNRAEEGLPENSFVFTCHNTIYKIGPEVFGVWMRLLRAVENSVLWLSGQMPAAMDNLRREASARGVAPERLVFAPRAPLREDHLARLRLADLFVDTLPYNAHTTACDALWAGLPVLTCTGHSFPARVASSLLHAVGLAEMVTSSLAEYENLALALARNPGRLAAVKAKLIRNRDTEPLFDTASFTRHLESAYTAMWERQQAGLPPTNLTIPR